MNIINITSKNFSKGYLSTALANRYFRGLGKYSTGKPPTCQCQLSIETIQRCLRERKNDALKQEMSLCETSKEYQINWKSYAVEVVERSEKNRCKAVEVFKGSLPPELRLQKNIKAIDHKSALFESHLSVFSSEPGEVTLAGEGGKHVGQKGYWEPLLSHLEKYKHLPVRILSIGGALGHDALAIAEVLKTERFNVQRPVVIDPNRLAAFLSEDDVDYYAMTSQCFFDTHFLRQGGELYIIHLGTTLNVIKEDAVVQILRQISQKMAGNDALSLIMVGKKQFQGELLHFGAENKEGISPVVYLKTGQHYKTVITDSKKFMNFMTSLGLTGEIVDIFERSKLLSVAFVAYKAIKKD